jgi:hypothetical protein
MRPIDPSARAALATAQERICKTVDAAVVEIANTLLMLVKSAATYRERGQLAFAQIHILESRELLLSSFTSALRDRIDEDLASHSETGPTRRRPTGRRSASSTRGRSRRGSRSSGSAS